MKITILGATGNIGQLLACLLKIKLSKNFEIFLYDISPSLEGVKIDLDHIPTLPKVKFSTDIQKVLKKTDIVLLCAGKARQIGMNRSDLLKSNASIVMNLTKFIAQYCPQSWIGIITNPVNITTVIASEVLKSYGVYNKKKLFGITTLDLIRSSSYLKKFLRGDSIFVPVIGGHSSHTILPLFSQVNKIKFPEKEISNLIRKVQNAGDEVVLKKCNTGSASIAMSYAAMKFTFSILDSIEEKKNVVEYAYIEGSKEFTKFFSQPFLLGKNGIKKYLSIGLINKLESNLLKKIKKSLEKDILLGKEFVRKNL